MVAIAVGDHTWFDGPRDRDVGAVGRRVERADGAGGMGPEVVESDVLSVAFDAAVRAEYPGLPVVHLGEGGDGVGGGDAVGVVEPDDLVVDHIVVTGVDAAAEDRVGQFGVLRHLAPVGETRVGRHVVFSREAPAALVVGLGDRRDPSAVVADAPAVLPACRSDRSRRPGNCRARGGTWALGSGVTPGRPAPRLDLGSAGSRTAPRRRARTRAPAVVARSATGRTGRVASTAGPRRVLSDVASPSVP